MKVSIVMGSKSDEAKVKGAYDVLKEFGVDVEVRCLSAHRAHNELAAYIDKCNEDGTYAIIACAGMAAALPGVIASMTTIPVIGVPLSGSVLDGMDALMSIVQMPSGIPVATVAINGTKNAAYLALQIIATSNEEMKNKLLAHRKSMSEDAYKANEEMKEKY